MCLITKNLIPDFTNDQLLNLVIERSDKDIVCFKRFNIPIGSNRLITPHKNFEWPINGSLVTVPKFGAYVKNRHLEIHEGLHAYTTKLAVLRVSLRSKIRKMIIPAGTLYVYNSDKTEIVALSMRLAKPEKKLVKKIAKKIGKPLLKIKKKKK